MFICNFFLFLCSNEQSDQVKNLMFDLLCPLVTSDSVSSVLPQLEFKLQSSHEGERMGCVSLLARTFSKKDNKLATQHYQLWRAFLGRQDSKGF